MTDDSDDIRDIRLMVMGESTYPGAVWRESVRDLLSEIDRLTAERDALREALQEGFDLIRGEDVGADWKRGCASFLRKARAALKGDGE